MIGDLKCCLIGLSGNSALCATRVGCAMSAPWLLPGGIGVRKWEGSGAPRSMKMGTILSPWHYDAGARHAFQSAKLRRPAMLHYALVSGGLPGVTGRPESDFATSRAHWRNNCTVGPRVLFLSVTTATGG